MDARLTERRSAVMSFRPAFATAVLSGDKEWEFRRVRCKLGPGDRVFIYAVTPIQRIVGQFVVGTVRVGLPDEMAQLERSPALRSTTADYLKGATIVTALEVLLPEPIVPTALSDLWPKLRPPRSYQYVEG